MTIANKLHTVTVWHYTRIDYLEAIEACGELRPKSESEIYKSAALLGRNVSQVPFIWFSSNQKWEPLCTQLGGGLRSRNMTWQELALCQKAIRFGIASNDIRLLDWKQTCNAGGNNRDERRLREKLSKQAKKLGSDASKWFTSTQPIPLKDLHLQWWFDGCWRDY